MVADGALVDEGEPGAAGHPGDRGPQVVQGARVPARLVEPPADGGAGVPAAARAVEQVAPVGARPGGRHRDVAGVVDGLRLDRRGLHHRGRGLRGAGRCHDLDAGAQRDRGTAGRRDRTRRWSVVASSPAKVFSQKRPDLVERFRESSCQPPGPRTAIRTTRERGARRTFPETTIVSPVRTWAGALAVTSSRRARAGTPVGSGTRMPSETVSTAPRIDVGGDGGGDVAAGGAPVGRRAGPGRARGPGLGRVPRRGPAGTTTGETTGMAAGTTGGGATARGSPAADGGTSPVSSHWSDPGPSAATRTHCTTGAERSRCPQERSPISGVFSLRPGPQAAVLRRGTAPQRSRCPQAAWTRPNPSSSPTSVFQVVGLTRGGLSWR